MTDPADFSADERFRKSLPSGRNSGTENNSTAIAPPERLDRLAMIGNWPARCAGDR